MPQLKVEQAPDAVIVIAILGAVLAEEPFDGGTVEKSAVYTARF